MCDHRITSGLPGQMIPCRIRSARLASLAIGEVFWKQAAQDLHTYERSTVRKVCCRRCWLSQSDLERVIFRTSRGHGLGVGKCVYNT